MTAPAVSAACGWVAIQRNRTSGAGRQYRPIVELMSELRQQSIVPRLYSSREELDAAVRNSTVGPPKAIVAAGGDGTVLDIVNRHPRLPVAILPLGTENLLARELAIPYRDGRFVARMIAGGRRRVIDLGAVGSLRFAIMASCGFDAAVLHAAHASRPEHITRGHYVRPLLGVWRTYQYPEFRVYLDEDPSPLFGNMVVVANLSRYACGLPLVPDAISDDGLLDVRLFSHRDRFQFLRELGNVLLRSARAEIRRAARVRIESDVPSPVQADGDPIGRTPVEITVQPRAATLVIP